MKVGLVLLNWNGGEFTDPCLASVLRATVRPWRTIVFDNASTDGSPDTIEAAYPEVRVVLNDRNVGFAAGNNAAVRALLDEGADLIWILNNDTVVAPDCLERLVAEYAADPELGALSGKILLEKPDDHIWYAGGFWRTWSFTVSHTGQGERDVGQFDDARDVEFLSGCCMLVPRASLERVGLFDERYFAYWEDAEWCLRARARGLRLRYVPGAVLWHKVSASMLKNNAAPSGGTASPFAHYLNQRNRLFCVRQHARRPLQLFSAVSWIALRTLYVGAVLALLRRWDKLASLLRGTRDGWVTPVS